MQGQERMIGERRVSPHWQKRKVSQRTGISRDSRRCLTPTNGLALLAFLMLVPIDSTAAELSTRQIRDQTLTELRRSVEETYLVMVREAL